MSTGCYFLGNLIQNVYNGKFFNVSNEDILQMLETKSLLQYFIIS